MRRLRIDPAVTDQHQGLSIGRLAHRAGVGQIPLNAIHHRLHMRLCHRIVDPPSIPRKTGKNHQHRAHEDRRKSRGNQKLDQAKPRSAG